MLRGITWAEKTQLNLIEINKLPNNEQKQVEILSKYKSGPFRIDNQNARQMIQLMYEYSRKLLDKDIDNKKYIDRD